MKITALKSNPNNPRIIKDDKFKKLVQSISDFPEMMAKRPIVCVTDTDGKLYPLGGNMRLKALNELNYKEIPDNWVTLADEWSIEKRNEFVIKDNVGFGEWNWDDLANDWDAEKLTEWGLDIPDFAPVHLDAVEDEYEMPNEIKTDIVIGDLFEIGEHRLLCGDSTDSNQIDKLMNGQKADLLLTDPPYGIGIDGQKKSIAKNPKHNRKHHEFKGWDNQRPEKSTFELIISYAKISIIWGGNYFADLLPATRGWIYWNKGQDGLTMSDGELAWTTEDKPLRSVIVNRAALQGSVHPTQKPIQVMNFCLNWEKDSNLILDTFLGSGSTMVAAHQLNRKCYGMELDANYCQVIVDRMLQLDSTLEIKRNGLPYESPHKNLS